MGLVDDIEEAERVARSAMPNSSIMAGTIMTSDRGMEDLYGELAHHIPPDLMPLKLCTFHGWPVTACIESEDSVVVVMFYRRDFSSYLGIPINYI